MNERGLFLGGLVVSLALLMVGFITLGEHIAISGIVLIMYMILMKP